MRKLWRLLVWLWQGLPYSDPYWLPMLWMMGSENAYEEPDVDVEAVRREYPVYSSQYDRNVIDGPV